MNDAPLWIVLVVSVIISSGALATTVSPTVKAAVEESARQNARQGRGFWIAFGLASTLGMVALTVAWVWHSFVTDDWRYAAIGLIPVVAGVIREPIRLRWIARARRSEQRRMAAS